LPLLASFRTSMLQWIERRGTDLLTHLRGFDAGFENFCAPSA
jgi:hypothetical protein